MSKGRIGDCSGSYLVSENQHFLIEALMTSLETEDKTSLIVLASFS